MAKKGRVKVLKGIKPRENVFGTRQKIMFGMRQDKNWKGTRDKQNRDAAKIWGRLATKYQISYIYFANWRINSYTLRKGEEFKGKVAKGTGRKRMNTRGRKTEGHTQKEGRGVLKFVSCLIITLKSIKENSAKGKKLCRIYEGKSTELRA